MSRLDELRAQLVDTTATLEAASASWLDAKASGASRGTLQMIDAELDELSATVHRLEAEIRKSTRRR